MNGETEVTMRLTFADPLNKMMGTLLIVFTAFFLVQMMVPPFETFAINCLALNTATFLRKLHVWQAVTAIFVHGSVCHFLGNMVFLWFFGAALANAWCNRDFLVYFFSCGIVSSVCFHIFNVLRVGSGEPGVIGLGASGAVFGLMMAYAMVYGDRTILAFFLIPMKAKYFVAICFAISILALWRGTQDGVGHIAHVSGAVWGAVYLKVIWHRYDRRAGASRGKAKTGSRVSGLEVMTQDHDD